MNWLAAHKERLNLVAYGFICICLAAAILTGLPALAHESPSHSGPDLVALDRFPVYRDATTARIPAGIPGSAFAKGDINGDGFIDILAYGVYGTPVTSALLNDGNGYFTAKKHLLPDLGRNVMRMILEDVDSDGDLDIFVVQSRLGEQTPLQNQLYLNDGQGDFTDVTAERLPDLPMVSISAIFADFKGDGRRDLFVTCGATVSSVRCQDRLFFNTGDGFFADGSSENIPVAQEESFGVQAGDIDDDNDIDLVVAVRFGRNKILINDGHGRFTDETEERFPDIATPSTDRLILIDVNGDGHLDLLEPQQKRSQPYALRDKLYLNDGSGRFHDATSEWMPAVPTGSYAGNSDVGDLDDDGFPEIYLPNIDGGRPLIYSSDGSKMRIVEPKTLPGSEGKMHFHGGIFLDADSDGDLDVVFHADGKIYFYEAFSAGTFE